MSRAARAGPGRRGLHPGAWWLWAACMAGAASRTTNPILLLLIGAVVVYVVSARRTSAPWSRSIVVFLRLGLAVILLRVVLVVVFGDRALPGHTIVTLPHVPLPSWAAGRQHRRPGDHRVHRAGRRDRPATCGGTGLLRRRQLAGQPVPAATVPARRAVRGRRGHHRLAVVRARTGHGHRRHPRGPPPAGPFDPGARRTAGHGRARPGAGARALPPAGVVHGRPRLRPAGARGPRRPALGHRWDRGRTPGGTGRRLRRRWWRARCPAEASRSWPWVPSWSGSGWRPVDGGPTGPGTGPIRGGCRSGSCRHPGPSWSTLVAAGMARSGGPPVRRPTRSGRRRCPSWPPSGSWSGWRRPGSPRSSGPGPVVRPAGRPAGHAGAGGRARPRPVDRSVCRGRGTPGRPPPPVGGRPGSHDPVRPT